MAKKIVSFLAAAFVLQAFPASRYWISYDGSGDGVWSDLNHWEGGIMPSTSDDHVFLQKTSGKISLDGSYSCNRIATYAGTWVLGGTGSLTELGGSYEHIRSGTSLEVTDSAFYNASVAQQYESYGTLKISGGAVVTKKYVAGILTEITGGAFTNKGDAVFSSGSTCSYSAGIWTATGTASFGKGSVLRVADGAELDMGKASFADGSSIILGAGSVLKLAHTSLLKTTNITVGASSRIVVKVPDGTAAARACPVFLPTGADISSIDGLSIELEAPEGWSGKAIGPCFFVTGGVSTTPSYDFEWTGAQDGYWSNGGNWHGGLAPTNGARVYISGERNTVMTNDIENASFLFLHILSGTAPVVVRGNPFKLTCVDTGWNANVSLRSYSSYPVVFENKVVFNTKYGLSDSRTSSSYICHKGGISQTSSNSGRFIQLSGMVAIGGSSAETLRRIQFRASGSGSLLFIDGADYTLTEQAVNLSHGGALTVAAGATVTVNGTCQVNNIASVVDGTLDFAGTLTGSQAAGGSGTIKTHGTFSTAAGNNIVSLGGSLALLPSSWNTQPGESTTFRICATNGTPRLAASSDWTYGPEEGEASAARALHIASGATLVVDTQDPETSEGHTISFVDPIAAEGSLEKTGAGTLALPAGDVSIGGDFAISGGAVKVAGTVAVAGTFSAAAGTLITFADSLVGDGKVAVVTASAVEGMPSVGGKYKLRLVKNYGEGVDALVVSRACGLAVFVK